MKTLTVRELSEQLTTMPQDALIVLVDNGKGHCLPLLRARLLDSNNVYTPAKIDNETDESLFVGLE